MLLTAMVNGLVNTNKNANQQQQQQQYQQPTNKSSKANKKTDKSNNPSGNSNSDNNNNNNNNNNNKQRSVSKKSMNNLLLRSYNGDNVKDDQARTQNFNINNNNNNSNNSNNSGNVTKSSTKVKSGSWKRSEKQVTSLNKKSKNSRKHSPAWLQFNNTGLKTVATTNTSGMASICRPGTSYSDVVFAAGSSCLVKVKTLTPRRVTNATQKKLTIALLKCSRPDKEGSDNSAVEVMGERKHDKEPERDHVDLFPELPDSSLKKTKCTTSASPASRSGLNSAKISSTASKATKKSHSVIVSSPRKKKKSSHKKNNILIVKNPNGGLLRNGSKLSLGNYLEQCINRNYSKGLDVARSNKINGKKGATRKPFSIDIPTWNTIDVSGELYPKFLCQFDDEHYLRAETAALLGLKLALGNSVQQGKFKFFN